MQFKKARYFFILILIIFIDHRVDGQNENLVNAHFTTWYENKAGAISISFDDASFTQYEYAYPILKQYNLKATFSLVGDWTEDYPSFSAEPGCFEIQKMGWKQLEEIANDGHELAAHGYYHQKYDKYKVVPELAVEMKKMITLIESETHAKVYTLHYPYSYASVNIPIAAKEAGYLFGRTGLDTVNTANPRQMYLLATHTILNNNLPDSVEFQQWLNQAKGNWLILIYHHLFPEQSKEMELIRFHQVQNCYSLLPETFEKQMEKIVASDYWIAPIASIGKYIVERNNTEIKTVVGKKKMYIFTFTNLDKNIYNQPLTIEIELSWKRVKIEGSLQDGIVEIKNNKLLVNILPENELILSKE